MEFNSSNDIIFDNIVEQIKRKNNNSYKCEIIKEEINNTFNLKFIKLSIDGLYSNSFIVDVNNEGLTGKKIKFNVNSLLIKFINNRPYFFIKIYQYLDEENDYIKFGKILTNLKSNLFIIITSTINTNKNYLYTLILKAKEIKIKTQKHIFQFEDSYKNSVDIDGLENFEFENGNLYCFNGYIYNNVSHKFEQTNISNIEKLSVSNLRIHSSKEIFESEINSLLNFKGKVKSFNIKDEVIIIEDEDKVYKVYANHNLIKQLVLDSECKFYYFFKKNNKEFTFSNLSFIEAKEETLIDFYFPFYDNETKYYNRIKINDAYYDINNKNIKTPIKYEEKSILFSQEISYERVIQGKTLDSYKFNLELDKGKIYHLISSSDKCGFSYEFYIQSTNEEDLPQSINIKYKDKIIEMKNPDKNGNKLKERFTIINFPKQNIKEILGLSDKENIIVDKDNCKYLLLIDNNKMKTLKQFEKLKLVNNLQKEFYVSSQTEIELEKASAQCNINFIDNIEDKLAGIDKNNVNIFEKLMLEIMDGNLKFENKKRHFKIIKDIVSFCINYYECILLGKYYSFRKNYEILLDSIINLEYIDRIKILITFMEKIMKNAQQNKVSYDMLYLVDIDNNKSYKSFPFVKDAFDIFFKVIDNLTEKDCELFEAIHQFNSIIYKDNLSGENQHSSSILNVNDIKLELVKNINRFIFLSEKPGFNCDDFYNFDPLGLLLTINIFSFSDDEEYIFIEKNFKKAASIVLILLFHECLGHQKKHINNENIIAPIKHHKSNFEDFLYERIDTGSALEIILIEKFFNLKYLMYSNNSEKLLDPYLYTEKDFLKLREIYSIIEEDNINKEKINNKPDSNKSLNNNKIQSKCQKVTEKKHHLMYTELIQLYSEVTKDDEEKFKDDEDFQRLLMLYKRRHQNPSEYLKIPNRNAIRAIYNK